MSRAGTMPLIAALVCFAIYFGNVVAGASGMGVMFGDVSEMLVLLLTSILFIIGVLAREKAAREGGN